jgi:hypothetical protein
MKQQAKGNLCRADVQQFWRDSSLDAALDGFRGPEYLSA